MKIWRYLDLAKFVNMLSSRALYFACPCEFEDPYESYLPLSHIEAHEEMLQKFFGALETLREHFVAEFPDRDPAALDLIAEQARAKLNVRQILRDVGLKIGVNCWHRNDSESAAMWQLYGNCIAIESSKDRLQGAMADNVIIYDVRYVDFLRDPIDSVFKSYLGFLKRTAFQHEQELRATISLKEPSKGQLVPCDLEVLIDTIHIAPTAPRYYEDAVRYVVDHANLSTAISVRRSTLLDPPDY